MSKLLMGILITINLLMISKEAFDWAFESGVKYCAEQVANELGAQIRMEGIRQ